MSLSLDRFVLAHRGPKAPLDPSRVHAALWEEERDPAGQLAATAVLFLANKECPFRCLMCDLWRHTLDDRVPAGSVPRQIRDALATIAPARQVKLYNAGSFFDPEAVPPEDDEDIARLVARFDRVVVEAHPAFLRGPYGDRCLRFRDAIPGQLEVAVGLETAHPGVLARLNKRMSLETFERAARFLGDSGVALRVFILLRPPFLSEAEGVTWACRSIDVAFDCGATACSVIPTRGGNGALEALGGAFAPPALASLERVVEYGVSRGLGRVFADLWDVERLSACECSPARAARVRHMNREQRLPDPVCCARCEP